MQHRFPNPRTYGDLFPHVNVADWDVIDGAVGPGKRLCIWLQGCMWRCPGCRNQDFLPLHRRHVLSPAELLALVDRHAGIDGVTLSGGEPLLQAEALVPFLRGVRERGLTAVCYSGWKLERLQADGAPPALVDFLGVVDLLIDGDYRADLGPGDTYCASSNQELRFLSGRITRQHLQGQPEQELTFRGGKVAATGTLPEEVFTKLREGLLQLGVRIVPEGEGATR
jgi:anaerobic ribonucleoside-triphosphate reductase activating protein